MALPDTYTLKPGAIPAYFEAMLNAEAPNRFTTRFLESLEFKSTNDRLFIGVLRELGFIDADGVPQDRYYEFLDRSRSSYVVAEGIREAYSDLFNVRKDAQSLSVEEVRNKLRTLYKGTKKDSLIGRIASTFIALCEYADFTATKSEAKGGKSEKKDSEKEPAPKDKQDVGKKDEQKEDDGGVSGKGLSLDSLQYHINIVLPESRDQAIYDAIFKSLRDHLGKPE